MKEIIGKLLFSLVLAAGFYIIVIIWAFLELVNFGKDEPYYSAL